MDIHVNWYVFVENAPTKIQRIFLCDFIEYKNVYVGFKEVLCFEQYTHPRIITNNTIKLIKSNLRTEWFGPKSPTYGAQWTSQM